MDSGCSGLHLHHHGPPQPFPYFLGSQGGVLQGAARASESESLSQNGMNLQTGTPPLAQARPRSQKSGQNGGSTPTPCLDKAVHARDTCDSQTGNNIVSRG